MHNYHKLTDNDLLQLISEKDELAFNAIYLRYFPLLFIYACKIIPDEDEVKDILQEVFVSLWTKEKAEVQISFRSYLYTAVRYKIFDHIDKQKVRKGYVDSFQDFIEHGECFTDHYILEKELRHQIEKEVHKLPKKMREIFVLSREGHQSYEEIAQHTNVSLNTVRKQISNALKIMRSKLASIFF